jgi:hypothetical protein
MNLPKMDFADRCFLVERLSDGKFSERLINFHYEYGVAERLTVVARLGYRFISFTYIDNLNPRLLPNERLFRVQVNGFDDSWRAARYAWLYSGFKDEGVAYRRNLGSNFQLGM